MDYNFDLLIKHENENTSLDFKKTQYIKENYYELLKDVIAFSNGNIGHDSHIILGMKVFADGNRDYIGIPDGEFTDSSDYQQLIENNIEPSLDIDYIPYKLESKTYGILLIKSPQDPPYMMKKDYTPFKKGDAWIRKGSNQERLTRKDLDHIQLKVNSQMPFEGNVSLEFEANRKKTNKLKTHFYN